MSLEPLPIETLDSPAASATATLQNASSTSSSVEPVSATQDVSELVEVLLSQVVENSGSDQIIPNFMTKKTKASKKKAKKDVPVVDDSIDYYVETGVVDLPPENDQQSDHSFYVPGPKKRKIAKKPKAVNLKVN